MNLILTKYGKIDILINNAGFAIFDTVINSNLEVVEEMINVNYLGMVRCTKSILPYMVQQNSGHIINIASVAGKISTAKAAAYSASKFAVIGFSNALRQEVAPYNILVSTINPGPIDTPFFDRADPSGNYVKNVQKMILSSEEVALAVYNVIIHKKNEITIPTIAHIGTRHLKFFLAFFKYSLVST